MIIYPVEFHRRLEQKWATRIDQIPLSQATRHHREIRAMTMITRTKTKRTRFGIAANAENLLRCIGR